MSKSSAAWMLEEVRRREPRISRLGTRSTGAVISGRQLVLATLERSSDGLVLYDKACAALRLEGRDTDAVRDLHAAVERLCRRARIRQIVVRGSPDKGPYRADPLAYKIECLLQFLASASVIVVPTLTVQGWIKRESPALPASPAAGVKAVAIQQRAIEMAGFVDAHPHLERVIGGAS